MKYVVGLLIMLSTFAGAQEAPATTSTLTPDEQLLIDTAVRVYLANKTRGDEFIKQTTENTQFLIEDGNRQNQAIADLSKGLTDEVNLSNSRQQENAKRLFELESRLAETVKNVNDLARLLYPINHAAQVGWSKQVAAGYAQMNGAVIPKGVKVFIGAVKPDTFTPFVVSEATAAFIKKVDFEVSQSGTTNLPLKWTEATAPFDFNSSGGQGVTFTSAGVYMAKIIVTFTDAKTDTVVAVFQVQ